MRKTSLAFACSALLLVAAAPAAAQTAGKPALYIGVAGGLSAVQNVGAAAIGEIGLRLSGSTDVFADAAWLQDVITRRRLGTADGLSAFLSQSQGKTASVTVEAPALVLAGGLRRAFGHGRARPYVMASAGLARITLQPTILVAGTDVTKTPASVGVALGEDLTGSTTHPVAGGGLGVVVTRGRVVIDIAARVFSIRTPDQATNAKAISAGFGYGF